MLYLPAILMGASSLLLQVICLRQLLSVFSGNELIIGITLGGWLTLVALGSLAGSRINHKGAFGLSFLLIALLSQPTIILIRSIRGFTPVESGEIISFPLTLLWTVISVAGICIVIGAQFPFAVRYLREKTAEVYGLEATGAFIAGGIFTFLLSGRVNSFTLVMILALINILASALILKRKALLLFIIIPIIIHGGGRWLISSGYRGLESVQSVESRYGEITVFRIKDQLNIYYSGKYLYSYPDSQIEETRAHLPMSLVPSAERILIVGGSPALIREFLKYPVSRIDFVEIDPVLIRISRNILTGKDRTYLEDSRVRLIQMDARRFIKSLSNQGYDLILLNTPEPSTANINRFYTVEFFREARAVLKKNGLLYLSLPTSSGYIGRSMQMANGSVYTTLKEVFPYVVNSSEEYGIIAGSMSPIEIDPDVLVRRFEGRDVTTEFFRDYILRDAFSPLKVDMVRARLGKVRDINSDKHPVSYLYNLILWSHIQGGGWLRFMLHKYPVFIFSIILILFMLLSMRREPVFYTIFSTGFLTMAFTLTAILIYQSYYGYIYEAIGMLTGTFMLGSASGSFLMRNRERPLQWLRWLDVLSIVLMLLAIIFMKKDFFFYLFIFITGMIGGGEFALTGSFLKDKGYHSIAGRLYAIDLAGSFPGSFVTTIFMLPVSGITGTITFLMVIKALSFILLLRYRGA